MTNGFTKSLFEGNVNRFLLNIFQPKTPIITVKKMEMYVKLPFLGDTSNKIEMALKKTLTNFYPYIDFKFIHTNSFRIRSFFNFKDRLPEPLRSSIIYNFKCPNCQFGYIGSSVRALKTRIHDHIGSSNRTGRPLTNPQNSAIRDHVNDCRCSINPLDFKIIDTANNHSDLRILESLYIKYLKPALNRDLSALPLNIA